MKRLTMKALAEAWGCSLATAYRRFEATQARQGEDGVLPATTAPATGKRGRRSVYAIEVPA